MSDSNTSGTTATTETNEVAAPPGPVMTVHPVTEPSAPVVEEPAEPERKPLEEWAQKHTTPAWLLAALTAAHRWAAGREVTEADFLKAADTAANGRLL